MDIRVVFLTSFDVRSFLVQVSVPALLDISATRQVLGGVSRSTIYALAKKGALQPIKLTRRTMFRREDVEALARTGA
ncbi:helix-turn-helix domain-containing protein [Sphingobium sp. AntQ-1]|uniref:helix-turn-helix domain-containing protein n=1 Tax=Sphingobium sp. AntQ-1 TaxID=2930091 RepID=UPI003FA74A65